MTQHKRSSKRRTRTTFLRIELSRSADSTLVLQEVQEIIEGSEVVTGMVELRITHIYPLTEEDATNEKASRYVS